jgi:3-dehydroquinate dehydratase/shikimate dehydrogenase
LGGCIALIVETVTAERMADLRRARDNVRDADLVELRLDGVTDVDVAGALAGRARPVVVTCRPRWEGGRFDGDEATRLRLLAEAIRLGADFVDIEWMADWRSLPRGDRTALVLSTHDFEGVPPDLAGRVRSMRATGAPYVKVAVTARRLADSLALRDAVRGDPVIAIAMGPAGQITRMCPWLTGSPWTYAGSSAPGQVSARTLAEVYRVRRTSASTALYGIAGAPLGHSASPFMHNSAFVDARVDAVYVPLETGDADEFFSVADAIALAGASVTAPLKSTVIGPRVEGDELAKRIGAVNTLRRRDGKWESRNFDVAGFAAPLERHGVRLAGRRAVVAGAGGAARAAVWALRALGARVEVAARRADRAEALAREFQVGTTPWPPAGAWDVLVNATPVGTWPANGESPIAMSEARGGVVYDLVYNPPETRLLAAARAAGAQTISGLDMLVSQACRQFEWWTGLSAPLAAIERGALEFVHDQGGAAGTKSPA